MKIIILFLYVSLISVFVNAQNTVGLIEHNTGTLDDGYVLFAPLNSKTTFLIDKCGKEVKNWTSAYYPGQSVYILPEGTLLRTTNSSNTVFTAGGSGGTIEKIDWNNNVVWSYTISDTTRCQHHDVKALPNGNVLVIAWEKKTVADAIAQGRNPGLIAASVWCEQILEIQPVGANGGNIVWEWHVWDHLVQDFDNSKSNFGTVSASPQLINLNYKALASTEDWLHINSVDYNVDLDQILLSSHSFSEIWIIDHSTSTIEAAAHTGGNSGKGGDLLYRWGNPLAYGNGSISSRKFWGQHNATWVPGGLPHANNIMVFNNGNGRTGGNYSTVEIIEPPVNGFNYTSTLPNGPTSAEWIYNAGNSDNFYAQNISGAQQLSNGNVLICNGTNGNFFEIDSIGTTLWKYINPLSNTGIVNQGASTTTNLVFRCNFYPANYTGFNSHVLALGNIIENSNTVSDSCSLTSGIEKNVFAGNILVYPNPTVESLNIDFQNIDLSNIHVQLFTVFGQVVYENKSQIITNKISIPTTNYSSGVYFLKILSGPNSKVFKVIIN